MKPVYIKYLVESVHEIFSENFGFKPLKGKISFDSLSLKADVSASIGLIGDLEGNIVLLAEKDVALKIASAMFMDEMTELDEMTLSCITELTNFIAGRMITKLFQLNYDNDITPPEILTQDKMSLDHKKSLGIRVYFTSDFGPMIFVLSKKK